MLLYDDIAVAYVRGKAPQWAEQAPQDLLARATAAGMPLHRFKRTEPPMARVTQTLGILRGLSPTSILDVGTGRGAFLWPLLAAIAGVAVTCVEADQMRFDDLSAVVSGGITRLSARHEDVCQLSIADDSYDVVTILEVLEHLPQPQLAAREVVRVARRFVVASVPSQPDDNPQHIQLFSADSLRALLTEAGARHVQIQYVVGHMIAIARV